MPEGKVTHIRLNEFDISTIETIKEFLEEKYKDLPPRFREVTTTDCIKYALSVWIYNYSNPNDIKI